MADNGDAWDAEGWMIASVGINDRRVFSLFHPDIAGSVHHSAAHGELFSAGQTATVNVSMNTGRQPAHALVERQQLADCDRRWPRRRCLMA